MKALRRAMRRLAAPFTRSRDEQRLRDEVEQHIAMAAEDNRKARMPPAEAVLQARLAFGAMKATKEAYRDQRSLPWLESVVADIVFGWRQLRKHRAASAAAILSLALATGACTSAFRLIDAMLLRPLPVSHPERLYVLAYENLTSAGVIETSDSFEYPPFRILRDAVKGEAELLAISGNSRIGITFGSPEDTEKAYRQFVSGDTFSALGLKPALGRAFTPADDVTPGGHPYAMLSYDFWQRRFAGNPKAIGMRFHNGNDAFEIIGIAPKGFTGTETGNLTDIFYPTMMNAKAINDPTWGWFRAWAQLKPGADPERVRQKLNAAMHSYRQDRVKAWAPGSTQRQMDQYVSAPLSLQSAAAGVSNMQKIYRQSLFILAALVGLVLLIACANVANLMTARAVSRARELALRVSIGAGRTRLVQMVLVESALLALIASVLGSLFAWRTAPFVVSMINPPDNPYRLNLPADWRVLAFAAGLTLMVTMLFGLAPALRASAVKPSSALKGGNDPHARHRLMSALVAAQVAFCFLVHFNAGLFVSTFERLASQPTGFSADRLLLLETAAIDDQPMEYWSGSMTAIVELVPNAERGADLVPLPAVNPPLQTSLDQVREYIRASKAESTLRGYQSDWRGFCAWTDTRGLCPLPASAETVAAFIADCAGRLKVGSIQRRLNAITEAHKALALESPTHSAIVANTMKGIRRTKGTAPAQKTAALIDDIRAMVQVTNAGLIGARDRALILLGFAGAFRRSELVGLTVADCQSGKDGLTVALRRSKTDQAGAGRKVGVPYGSNPETCPVRILNEWIERAGIAGGPEGVGGLLFRSINRHGQVQPGGLSGLDVARVVKKLAERAGLDAAKYAGHSLRAGHATSAAIAGASERSIMNQTGHRSVQMVRRYIRDGSLFRENSGGKLGL